MHALASLLVPALVASVQAPSEGRWRLEAIYADEAAWRADLARARSDLDRLTDAFRDWTSSPSRLRRFLEGHAALSVRLAQLNAYPSLRAQVELDHPGLADMESQAQQVELEAGRRFARLPQDLQALGETGWATFQAREPALRAFDATFRHALRRRPHTLPEASEALLAQLDGFADGARQAGELLEAFELPHAPAKLPDGTQVPPGGGAWGRLAQSPRAVERQAVSRAWAESYTRVERTFAALLDARVKREAFEAKVRAFPDIASAQFFESELDPALHARLLERIQGALAPYHRYLAARRRLLGLAEYHPSDRSLPTPFGAPLRFTFPQTREALEAASSALGPEYLAGVRVAFDEGWMDRFPRKGKAGLGSATAVPGVHPYILLNFEGTFFDADTVAHEVGHALQFHLADRSQPFAAASPSWFTTEIPSQVSECLFVRELLRRTDDDRQRFAILGAFLDRLELCLVDSTRQAAFRDALHQHVEGGGTLTAPWLNATNLALLRRFGGDAMVVDDFLQHTWDHRTLFGGTPLRGFSFAFNAALALVLSERIRTEGAPAAARYVAFLKAGSSRPPLELLKAAGLDFEGADPFTEAMAVFGRLGAEWEALGEKLRGRERALRSPASPSGHGCCPD